MPEFISDLVKRLRVLTAVAMLITSALFLTFWPYLSDDIFRYPAARSGGVIVIMLVFLGFDCLVPKKIRPERSETPLVAKQVDSLPGQVVRTAASPAPVEVPVIDTRGNQRTNTEKDFDDGSG